MAELIALLIQELKLPPAIEPDTPLMSSGLIDSFHLTDLLAVLESHYRVRIDVGDIGADNFDTARQIHEFINASR
ncbi:MAG TPA: phosphopantetheine-binding protein [Candidatus Angelobacter sp.]|jgi:acyl carrier protein|nr:phosphopantetheine-binding protein [Candidatus Angelobacter sp.]